MRSARDVKRGDIYMVDWGGDVGVHPGLIVQNDAGNKFSDNTIVAYVTSTPARHYPVMVGFGDHESGLDHGGSIHLGRIMTVKKALLKEKKGCLSILRMKDVDRAIMVSLGIEDVRFDQSRHYPSSSN